MEGGVTVIRVNLIVAADLSRAERQRIKDRGREGDGEMLVRHMSTTRGEVV